MAKAFEALLDELYATAPADFTKKRDALAKEAADKEEASALKARRKPTQTAYALNQLARRNADDVADLVDAGRALARAQRKALRGEKGTELREAIGRQREVVRSLTTKAADLMRELGLASEGHLDEIAGALQAALVDPAVGEALEAGRLEKVPEPAASFAFLPPGEALPKGVSERDAEKRAEASALAKREADEERAANEARREREAKEKRTEAAAQAKREAKERGKAEARKERASAKERAEAEARAKREAKKKATAERAARRETERAAQARAVRDAKNALDEREAEAAAFEAKAKAISAQAKALLAEAQTIAREAVAARRDVSVGKKKLAALRAKSRGR